MIKIDYLNTTRCAVLAADNVILSLVRLDGLALGRLLSSSLKRQRALLRAARFAIDNGAPNTCVEALTKWKHERRMWLTVVMIVNSRAIYKDWPIDNRLQVLRDHGLDWDGEVAESARLFGL